MKNTRTLRVLDRLIRHYRKVDNDLYNKYREDYFDKLYGEWSDTTFLVLENEFFRLLTKEKSISKFHDRFDSPGCTKGQKPVAWADNGFIPDAITETIMSSTLNFDEKVTKALSLYEQCIALEKEFYEKK